MSTRPPLSIRELAEQRLGVSYETVRRWIAEGKISFDVIRFGKRITIPADEADRIVDAYTRRGKPLHHREVP